jgi:alpha-D-ribose 1-methylphosphonate 5-triphosphate synthase subunit PhnG
VFLIDEPLFLIHHIDIMVSVTGSNLLQNIKESLQLPPEYEIIHNPETGKDEVGSVMFDTLLQNIVESLQLPHEYEIIHNPETGKDEVGSIVLFTLLQNI